jgi:hypothetical protein
VTRAAIRALRIVAVAAAAWVLGGASTAEAIIGAPATPVSYAGVARRSTVGAGAPGVGVTPGVGVGAPGVGVGAPGVGVVPNPGVANVGGPVNRVGVR